MAAVTIHSDFRAQEQEIYHYFHLSPSICHEVMRLDAMILVFLILSFKLALSLSSFTLTKRLFSSSPDKENIVFSIHLWHFLYQYLFKSISSKNGTTTWSSNFRSRYIYPKKTKSLFKDVCASPTFTAVFFTIGLRGHYAK